VQLSRLSVVDTMTVVSSTDTGTATLDLRGGPQAVQPARVLLGDTSNGSTLPPRRE
jgi:hypothetical protein